MAFLYVTLTLVSSYLLGSLSSAVLVAKLLGVPDPRRHGSNNPGATNMLRLGGKKAGALTFFGDCLKGFIPAFVFGYVFTDMYSVWYGSLAGSAAMFGHCFPVFMRFNGGKGVATYVGMLFAISFWLLLVFGLVWLTLTAVTRYVSLASMLAGLSVAVVAFIRLPPESALLFTLLAGLIVLRHRDNLRRLVAGKENKVSLSRKQNAR